MKGKLLTIASTIALALGVVLLFSGVGVATPGTTMAIDPKVGGSAPNELFSVNVTIFDVAELYAWQFNITFDPSVLEVVSAVEGPFLKQAGSTMSPNPVFDNVAGYVLAGSARFPFDAGASGSGVLATVTFRVKAEGQSQLHFQAIGQDTKLRSWNGSAIVAISFVAVDGSFSYPLFELVHDVAITDVAASPLTVEAGGKVSVNVTVVNRGNLTESFDVMLYCDTWVIEAKTVSDLFSGAYKTLVFEWDTKNVDVGDYVLTFVASPVAGEVSTLDNSYSFVGVKVTESSQPLPMELIPVALAVVAVMVVVVIILLRRRR